MREDEDDSCDGEGREELRVLAKEQPKQQHNVLNRVARRPNKPNAYNYYQKLVQDFQSLDNELQVATTVQEQLHRKVDYLQIQQQVSIKEQLAAQQKQWERERDLEIETIVRKSEEVDSLHAKVNELDALELRLLAEIQVLQEKQQEEIRTEAFRIHELVHEKTHLFEAELAKGRTDLEFIAQVVKNTHNSQNHEEERESARNRESIHAIAEEIQQRRRQDFELAAQNLNARLLSFEQEKEALSKKANDIRTRKQRALQILSTNQQQAIKTFFSSASPKSSDRNMQSTPVPQLGFSSTLESLNQSGSQVGQIQSARNEKMSARKTMEEALQEARATLAVGEKRIEALQKTISTRQKDAETLHIFLKDSNPNYDGRLGIESYPPVKYELAIFIRGVVFEWAGRAVAQAESEPDIQLLKHEIQSWEATHSAVEQEGHIQFRATCAMLELAAIINEVMHEIATDIHSEFWSSCTRVRGTIGSVFREVFFVNAELPGARNSKPPANSTQVKNALSQLSSVLASAMFNHAYEQMRISRKQRAALHCETPRESVQFLHLVTQPKKLVIAAKPTIDGEVMQAAATQSPKKKRFGFFSSSKQSKNTPTSHSVSRDADSKDHTVDQEQLRNRMRRNAGGVIQLRPGDAEPSDPQSSTKVAADKKFWQQMFVEIDQVAVLSTFAHPSCVEVASDGSFCVIGTVSGELLVFDLLHRPPLLLKSHVPPAKSAKSGISKIIISANKTQLVIRNQLKVIHVWSVNRVLRSNSSDQQQHFSGCFALDNPQKWKPQPLDLLMELNSELMLQPGLPNDVKEWIPTVKTLTTTLPPQFLCTNWFSTTTLLGDQTSLVCGHSSGDILKYNMGARGGPNKPKSSIFDAEIAAKFNAPRPSDLMTELSSQDITREFFCGHKHPVLFLKCFQSNKGNSHAKLLSVDSNANVLEWEYDAKHFSGFGWFTPARQYHLDLVQPPTINHSNQQGEILQITATVDEKRVVLMVFFKNQATKKSTASSSNSSGKLRFYQLLLTGERIQIAPARVQLDFAGNSPPPMFALSTVYPRSKGESSRHFLFLLMNNSVQITSLDTGESCCAPISLQQKNEASLAFNTISVSERCLRKEKAHCCMVVAGEHHNKILVYRFKHNQYR